MEKILSRLQEKMHCLDSEYSDARYVEFERLKIRVRDGALEETKETVSRGVGIRVLKGGAFGFSATGDMTEKSLFHHLDQAHQMARHFSKIRHADVKLIPAKPVKKNWKTEIKTDPWSLSMPKKIKPLIEAQKELLKHSQVSSATGTLDFTRKKTIFISNEGSRIEQIHYRTGGWISAEIWEKGERIKRSWPGPTGRFRAQGYEAISDFEFEKETKRLAEELKELKRSPETPSGTFDLILKGSILALQIHETFGHASESDRVYGYEDNFGGRTFLNPGLIGGAAIASPMVNVVSDATDSGTGSFAFDDEGTGARRVDVIKKGVFQNYLTSRETAYFLNQKHSSANMAAEDWSHYPLIRMSNLNLLPGKGTLNEMIRNTKDGIMVDNELSWSIDEMRLGFQIGGEMGYRIKNGKIAGLVRFPIYHGNTIDFWRACDAIAGPKEWSFWGFSDCGKGGPYQEAFTGHGLSPVRFQNIRFGRE